MNKVLFSLLAAVFTVGTIITQTLPARAQEAPSAKEETKKRTSYPFRGKISSVDLKAKTFTIKSKTSTRVFHVSAAAKIMKSGKPAKLEDAMIGEEVGGTVKKDPEGKLQVISVRFGPKEVVTATKP